MPTLTNDHAELIIKAVVYERKADVVVLTLSTGAFVGVPRRVIPGLADAEPAKLKDLTVMTGGDVVWSDAVDSGVHLDQIVSLAIGDALLRRLGARAFASTRTPKRAAASRSNGAKGGRPRKKASTAA